MLQFNFSPFPVIETPRLVLRQPAITDTPEMFFLRSDEGVMRYIDRARAAGHAETEEFIGNLLARTAANADISWAITLKGETQLVGYLGFWNIRREHFRAETGYALHPRCQGKGIAAEAVAAVLGYGFGAMGLHSVEANVNPANEASIRLLERQRFVREAYYKEDYFYNGRFLDSAVYSLLAPATL